MDIPGISGARRGAFACATLAALALAACGDDASGLRDAVRAGFESVREPSADAIRTPRQFAGAGLAFDYPSPLRLQHARDEGDDVWSLGYGLYEMELYVTDTDLAAAQYLAALSGAMGQASGAVLAEAPRPGRRLALCGHPTDSTVMRVKLLGDETIYESFDLPPTTTARARLLTISYEPQAGRPPALAAAAEAMLLRSLRCDGAAAPGDPPKPAAPDPA